MTTLGELMGRYPLLDEIGAPALIGLLLLFLVFERFSPLRSRVDRWLRRIVVNLILAAPSFLVLRLLLIPAVVAVAQWAGRHDWGLLRQLPVPPLVATILAVLLLDYSMYGWHWLNHRIPFFWRFHHVHHSDLDLDVSTAFRFHFGEMLFSVVVRSLQVVLIGASPTAALVYEIVLEASTEFHHSNLRLPYGLERVLSWFIMTPRAHGIHHSIIERETNSNYSNFLIWWDRLHGTVRLNVKQNDIVVGVPEYRDPHELTVLSLLTMPFRRRRVSTSPIARSAAAGTGDKRRLVP
jgi:sterol desaturase/sphingolipid hydroxylase (fatty acid hydroxylase superfamily)